MGNTNVNAGRIILINCSFFETSLFIAHTVAVKHFGFGQQDRQLARRDFLAIGATYSKFLRCGRVELMYIPAYEFIKYALWPPIWDLLHLRKPRGIARITAFVKGFIEGLRVPLDKATMIFVDDRA